MDIIGQHHAGYGYRRVTRKLRKMDILVSGKRVLHIMQRLGLAVEGAARKHRKQKALEPCDPKPYIVERVFSVKGKYRLRMGGIAYIATKEGWFYPLLTEPSRSNYFVCTPFVTSHVVLYLYRDDSVFVAHIFHKCQDYARPV